MRNYLIIFLLSLITHLISLIWVLIFVNEKKKDLQKTYYFNLILNQKHFIMQFNKVRNDKIRNELTDPIIQLNPNNVSR